MNEQENDNSCEPLLMASEVARILKVKTVTVHAAATDGRLPCVRVWQGKRRALLRFRRRDIEALIANRPESRRRTTS